ncbi:MAG: hypothetical protein IPM33_12195 [Phycisphaerales bacterium]|nr:hypothetical protein [Phycisphaerales bacterium]
MFASNQSGGGTRASAVFGSGLLAGGEVVSGLAAVIYLASIAASLSGDGGASSLLLCAQGAGMAQAAGLFFAIALLPSSSNGSTRLLRLALVPGVLVPLAIAIPSPESLVSVPWAAIVAGVLGVASSLLGARCSRRGQGLYAARASSVSNAGGRGLRKAA